MAHCSSIVLFVFLLSCCFLHMSPDFSLVEFDLVWAT
jgi:hypothetical protein